MNKINRLIIVHLLALSALLALTLRDKYLQAEQYWNAIIACASDGNIRVGEDIVMCKRI